MLTANMTPNQRHILVTGRLRCSAGATGTFRLALSGFHFHGRRHVSMRVVAERRRLARPLRSLARHRVSDRRSNVCPSKRGSKRDEICRSSSRFRSLFEHELFGKTASHFLDHALVGIQGGAQALIRQQVLEIGDRLNKTLLELRLRSPAEFLSLGNVRTPLPGIVLRKWLVNDLGR